MQLSLYKRERLRIMGIYLIIIMVFSRFALWPLSSSVEEKKALLDEYIETYQTKVMLVQKKGLVDKVMNRSTSLQEKDLLASLFPKDSLDSEIQIKTLNAITQSVEKNGLSIINFQFPENAVSKDLGEVSVMINLNGIPNALIGLLKDINEMKMLTDIKTLVIASNKKKFTVKLTLTNYRIEG